MPSSALTTVPSGRVTGAIWRVEAAVVLRRGGLLVRGDGELVELLARRSPTARRSSRRRCPGSGTRRRSASRNGGAERVGRRRSERAHRHPAHRLDAAGDDDVVLAGDQPGRGEVHRLLARSRTAGRRSRRAPISGQPAASTAVRRDVEGLLADLADAAPDDVVDERRVDAGALRPARCSTCADRSAGCTPDSPPLRLPTGVRTASTITASRMSCPFRVALSATIPRIRGAAVSGPSRPARASRRTPSRPRGRPRWRRPAR